VDFVSAELLQLIAVEFEMFLSYLLPCILYVLDAPKVLNKQITHASCCWRLTSRGVLCCCSEASSGVYEDPEAINGHATG